MGILIFIPDYEGDDRNELAARGLGDLVDASVDAIFTPISKGPTGGSGRLVTFYPGNAPREYDAKSQTWIEAPPDGELKAGRYWLGYVTKAKPRPEDFQRRNLIEGEAVVLADDKVWVIPCCEHAPKRITRNRDTGAEMEVVKGEYQEWVESSNEIFGYIMADGYAALSDPNYKVPIKGGMRYCALSLRNNYRVNYDVVDLLQLIDSAVISDVILAACGITSLANLIRQKKNTNTPSPC